MFDVFPMKGIDVAAPFKGVVPCGTHSVDDDSGESFGICVDSKRLGSPSGAADNLFQSNELRALCVVGKEDFTIVVVGHGPQGGCAQPGAQNYRYVGG
jgi:hypothetical protein